MVANFSQASFAWGLEAVAGLHRIPFDAALVLSQFPPPHTVESFGEAAQGLGIRTGLRQVRAPELRQLPLPCLAVMNVPAGDAIDPAPEGERAESGTTCPDARTVCLSASRLKCPKIVIL